MTGYRDLPEWLTAKMKERGYSLRAVADRMTGDGLGNVGHSSVKAWQEGRRPSREHCVRLARVLREEPRYVLQLAGYPEPNEGTYILEATLSPEEETIVMAYRTGDPDVQGHLLAAARLAMRLQTDSAQPETGEGT